MLQLKAAGSHKPPQRALLKLAGLTEDWPAHNLRSALVTEACRQGVPPGDFAGLLLFDFQIGQQHVLLAVPPWRLLRDSVSE